MWIYIRSGWLCLIEFGTETPGLHEAFSGKAVQSCQDWWRGLLSPVLESHHLHQIFCGTVGFSLKVKHLVTNNPEVSLPDKHTGVTKTHPLEWLFIDVLFLFKKYNVQKVENESNFIRRINDERNIAYYHLRSFRMECSWRWWRLPLSQHSVTKAGEFCVFKAILFT